MIFRLGSNYNIGRFIYGKETDMYGIEIGNETGVRVQHRRPLAGDCTGRNREMGRNGDQDNIARVGNGIPGNSGVVWNGWSGMGWMEWNGMDGVEWDGQSLEWDGGVGKTLEMSEMDLVKIWYMTPVR